MTRPLPTADRRRIHNPLALSVLFVPLMLISCTTPTPASPHSTPTPDPFPALLAAGDACLASGERTAAEEDFWQAAALRPRDPTPHLRLAHLYLEWNRPEEGLAAASVAEQLGGSTAEVESLRTALYAALGDWESAVSHGTATLTRADAATRRLVVRGYLSLGRLKEAQEQLQLLLEVDPTDGPAQEQLGFLLALSDPTAALPYLQKAHTPLASDLAQALGESSDDPAHRLTLIGRACLAHDEPALAQQALERAVAHNPLYADSHALLGQALSQLGRTLEARVLLEEAVLLAPDSVLAHSLLGLYLLQAGDPAQARPHLEAAYDLDPENPALSLYLAQTYADLGQYAAAETWLAEATRLAPDDPSVWETVARFYLDRGMPERTQGLEAAQQAAAMSPDSAAAADLLGWACFLAGDTRQAEEHLLQAVERDPSFAVAHYHLGQVYAYLNRTEEARATLTRALDLCTDPALRTEIQAAAQNVTDR